MVYNKFMEPTCLQCHAIVKLTDYFCANCGKNLKEKPLSTSPAMEILYYLGSLALPPLGIIWGIKYLRQADPKAKRIGVVSIILTLISGIITIIWTMNLINGVSAQLNSQLNGIPGL